jgi:hypothetical protein
VAGFCLETDGHPYWVPYDGSLFICIGWGLMVLAFSLKLMDVWGLMVPAFALKVMAVHI